VRRSPSEALFRGSTVSIHVRWGTAEAPLGEREIVQAVEAALAHGGRAGIELDVVLVDDPTLAEMHERFLGDPSPTDVIAFDLGPEGDGPRGEIYVSVDRARAIARERGTESSRELALYLVHGTLHLCGHDDHEDADRERMRAAEALVLARLGYPPDELPHEIDDE
jgi:probable rRNA maturation factor